MILAGSLAAGARGQVLITNFGAYGQNFDAYAGSNGSIPSGWSISFTGTPTFGGTNAGTTSTGGAWAFGSRSDFSFGALRTGTPGNITLAGSFANDTGFTLTSLTLTWNYEQYRYQNTSGFSLIGTGALAGNTVIAANGFTGTASGTSGVVNQTPVSITLTNLAISNGASFGFQWTTTDLSGSDNSIAIDDFVLTATAIPEPSTYAAIIGAAILVAAIWQRRRRARLGLLTCSAK